MMKKTTLHLFQRYSSVTSVRTGQKPTGQAKLLNKNKLWCYWNIRQSVHAYLLWDVNRPLICPEPSHPGVGHIPLDLTGQNKHTVLEACLPFVVTVCKKTWYKTGRLAEMICMKKKLGYIKKQQRNNSAIRINAQCTFISFDTQRKIFSASFARKDS